MDGSRIKEITPNGLTYLNEQDEEVFIDFAACSQNWIDDRTSEEALEKYKAQHPNMTDQDVSEFLTFLKNSRYVANRDIYGSPSPFIEFYTKPPLRFQFATQDAFYQVKNAIHKTEWRTFDMT